MPSIISLFSIIFLFVFFKLASDLIGTCSSLFSKDFILFFYFICLHFFSFLSIYMLCLFVCMLVSKKTSKQQNRLGPVFFTATDIPLELNYGLYKLKLLNWHVDIFLNVPINEKSVKNWVLQLCLLSVYPCPVSLSIICISLSCITVYYLSISVLYHCLLSV